MIITSSDPEVLTLKSIWDSVGERTDELSEELKQRLVKDVFAPAVQEFNGELILKYQEFLSRVPNGNHSLAYGSEMVTKTVYWASVARIAHSDVEEVLKVRHLSPKKKFIFVTPSKVLVPVLWETYLEPQYRGGKNQTHFAVGEIAKANENKFDISLLGHYLFRFARNDLDWATKIEIAVGNESVSTWLRERESADVFSMLMRR